MSEIETEMGLIQIPQPKEPHLKLLKIESITTPHLYCITPKHLQLGRMYLDADAIRDAEKQVNAVCDICRVRAKKGLQQKILTYDEHESIKTLFIEIAGDSYKEDLNQIEGLHQYLLGIKEPCSKIGIQGFAFIKGKGNRRYKNE